jgi:hypothetical protein
MIWAVSTFNDELNVLEIRLKTLSPLVDRFVLTEATVTQRGQPKPLYFAENKERFAEWLPKIVHVVVEDMPAGEGSDNDWARERFQRSASGRGLYPDMQPEDQVLVGDLDEIPYPQALEAAFNTAEPTKFLMDMFVYRLNWRWLDRGCLIGSTATLFRGKDFQGREVGDVLLGSTVRVSDGIAGWHLAYQGDVERLRRKMTCIADNFYAQLVPEEKKGDPDVFLSDEWIQESIDTGRDIYGRDYRPSEWVDITELPPCVQADPARYAHMMVPRPAGPSVGVRCSCGGYIQDGELRHFPRCEVNAMAVA